MKIKTSELSGVALDWAVAKVEGYMANIKSNEIVYVHPNGEWHHNGNWNPSNNHIQGGLIIETNEINTIATGDSLKWKSDMWNESKKNFTKAYFGRTYLIAAMRCYVASKLGEEVEIPDSIISNLT